MKKRLGRLSVLLVAVILTGCDRQEMIQRFNNVEEVSVDNFEQNTESVDSSENISDQNGETGESNGSADSEKTEEAGVNGESQDKVADGLADKGTNGQEQLNSGPQISLIMVGDMLLHMPVEESAVQEDGSYNFDALFSNVSADIRAADLALVNQEVIIGGEELGVSGYPCFNAPYEAGDALVTAGFDVILHGTNHALDQGKAGIINCMNFWKKNYPEIAVLGINDSAQAQENIYIFEQDGIKIAILNYTYGTNGIELPSGMPYAVDLLEEEKIVADIAKAEELADFTIVCPHWGTEYKLDIDSWQKKWTKIFLENGVDLVIGTHPHVIEPIEIYTDETTGNEMLVYYSLGNFVSWTSSTGEGVANRMVGGMADVTIGLDESGKAYISDYGVTALVCHLTEGTNGVSTYYLSDYSQELADKNAIITQDSNFSYEYCVNLCNEVWGDEWE